jgi:hypothetical protein
MHEADYSEARQELLQWKEKAPSWNAQLEEILGDLNWMQGYHSKALTSYHDALQKRPNDFRLQNKIDRLVIRNGRTVVPPQPKANLKDLGLALYSVEPIGGENLVQSLAQARLKIADLFSLDAAFLTTPGENPKTWSLTGSKDLQKAGSALSFNCSSGAPDCKDFLGAAVDWAVRTGKTWIALARLGSIITAPFLRELQDRLAHRPSALVVDRWDILVSSDGAVLSIPERRQLAPALILIHVDWWKANSWRFHSYDLREIDWMALYAIKILRLTEAHYLCDAEQRLPTLLTQLLSVGRIKRLRQLVSVLKGDLDAALRLNLSTLYCRSMKLNLNHNPTQTKILFNHFFRGNLLKSFSIYFDKKERPSRVSIVRSDREDPDDKSGR